MKITKEPKNANYNLYINLEKMDWATFWTMFLQTHLVTLFAFLVVFNKSIVYTDAITLTHLH
jgi:hypothetical protein